MALGEALMEEQEFRRLPPRLSGALVHKFPSMLEYKSPTTLDMPEIFTELVEHPDPRGPFGAKEVGQGPLLPVMPALANAVYGAVGVRIDEIPITPEKIVAALKAKASGKEPRFGPPRFPDIQWPEPLHVPPPWEGGDGTASASALAPASSARVTLMMRLAPLHVSRAANDRGGGRFPRRGERRRDARRRRDGRPAEHEATAADAGRPRRSAWRRRASTGC